MSNEQVRTTLDEIKLRYRDGVLEESTMYTALMKVALSIEASRKEKMADRTRKILDALHSELLQLIYLFFTFASSKDFSISKKDVLKILYTIEQESDSGNKEKVSEYQRQLNEVLRKKFPNLKKRTYKKREELKEEAYKVSEMILNSPSMPEKAGEVYHIVSTDWMKRWKAYTRFDELKCSLTPGNFDNDESDRMEVEDDIAKLQIHKEGGDDSDNIGLYPGIINNSADIQKLVTEDKNHLKHPFDLADQHQLSNSAKEGQDYMFLTDDVWQYLYEIYGGQDIPRYSIEVLEEIDIINEEEEGEVKPEVKAKKSYVIEERLKKLNLYILPKVKTHLSLKSPSGVYITRKGTVFDYRKKVAEILHDHKKERSVEELMGISRIWKLEIGEDVLEIEKYLDYESRGKNFPLELRGRILENSELVESINVADSDVLLYEVQNDRPIPKNDNFVFIPKELAVKESRSKSSLAKFFKGEEEITDEMIMALPLEKVLESRSRGGITGL